MDFFITGLPRSRTAWLANFLTTGASYCAHDALLGVSSFVELDAKLRALPGELRGDSDSAALLFAPRLFAMYPEARWVVVLRDPEEVVWSLLSMEPYAGIEKLSATVAKATVALGIKDTERLYGNPRVHFVEFEALDSMATLRGIWEWCLGDRVPWCPERAAMLDVMRVEVIPAKVDVSLPAMASLLASVA